MSGSGGCEHCGVSRGTRREWFAFERAGRELLLELCSGCREEILAEDGIRLMVDA